MLNHQRRLTLLRPSAAPTATQLRAVLTLHVLLLQERREVSMASALRHELGNTMSESKQWSEQHRTAEQDVRRELRFISAERTQLERDLATAHAGLGDLRAAYARCSAMQVDSSHAMSESLAVRSTLVAQVRQLQNMIIINSAEAAVARPALLRSWGVCKAPSQNSNDTFGMC